MGIRLGIRTHDLNARSMEELVGKVKNKNLKALHLAPMKLQQITHTDRMTPGLAQYLYDPIQKNHLCVSILGCYVNIVDPEIKKREEAINTFNCYLDNARWFNNAVVGTETGTVSSNGYTTLNFSDSVFNAAVNSVKRMAQHAESVGTLFAIEPGINHPICDIKKTRRILELVNSPNLKLIFDPVNLITQENEKNQEKLIYEFINSFQDRIVAFHLKDFIFTEGEKRIVPFGQGQLNKEYFLKTINEVVPYSFCTFEGLDEKYLNSAINEVEKWVSLN